MASLLDCAAISWAAYVGLAGINKELPDICRNLLLGYEIRDVVEGVVIAKKNRCVVLAFRGTVSWRDIDSDLELWRTEPCRKIMHVEGALVHDGFADAYRRVARDCVAVLKDVLREGSDLTVTGHSLGAAKAALCALHVSSALDLKNVRCVTFGLPGVGNAAFVSAFASTVTDSVRVAHVRDPIPKILPAPFFIQPPELHSVKGEAIVSRVANSGFLSQLWGMFLQLVEGDIRYHRLATYIACLMEGSDTKRVSRGEESGETPREALPTSTGLPEGPPTSASSIDVVTTLLNTDDNKIE